MKRNRAIAGCLLFLAACSVTAPQTERPLPANEAIRMEFERVSYTRDAQISVPGGQYALTSRLAPAARSALAGYAEGAEPVELLLLVERAQDNGSTLAVWGALALRNLRTGTYLTTTPLTLDLPSGAETSPAASAAIGAALRDWLDPLVCTQRRCVEPGTEQPMLQENPPAQEEVLPVEEPVLPEEMPAEAPVVEIVPTEELPVATAAPRPTPRIRNTGAVRPETVIAQNTQEARAEARATPKPTERAPVKLGTTVASLGLLERGGFWLRTPLVTEERDGRIEVPGSGRSLNVRLIPREGASPSAGSQISLSALVELGFGVADLATLDVFAI